MFSSEIKEVVYIGVSLMILSLVLGMVVIVSDIRSDFAAIRNNEISTIEHLREYRQFNKYNDKDISGVDVIEIIREFKDKDIEIYVDRVNGGSNEFYSTLEKRASEPNLVTVDQLQSTFKPDKKYRSYLVYDYEDIRSVTGITPNEPSSVITGIAIIYD